MAKQNANNSTQPKVDKNNEVKALFDQFPSCKQLYRIPTGEFFTEENMARYNEPNRDKIEVFNREVFYAPEPEVQVTQEPSAE